jgi:hypothetical protein
MSNPHKTTVVTIYTEWDESRAMDLGTVCDFQIDLAHIVADRCQMDILSISHVPVRATRCNATCVYYNNGMTLDAIVAALRPEAQITTPRVWQMVDAYKENRGIRIYQVMNEDVLREVDDMRRSRQ